MFEFTVPSEELKVLKDKIMNIYQELKKESDNSWEIITTSEEVATATENDRAVSAKSDREDNTVIPYNISTDCFCVNPAFNIL